MLKTRPKQLLGSLPLDIALPESALKANASLTHDLHSSSLTNNQLSFAENFFWLPMFQPTTKTTEMQL